MTPVMWIFARRDRDSDCPFCLAHGMMKRRGRLAKCLICFRVWNTKNAPTRAEAQGEGGVGHHIYL